MKPKYYLPFIPIIAIMFFLISVANAEYFSGLLSFSNNQRSEFPYVIAHRGASSLAPENTLAAINKAIELNADLIEIDVHLTRDGHPVVIHDKTVGRTTSGSGKVSRLSLTQLKQLDAGSWFGEHFKGEKIPTLEEVLLICQNRIPLLVELKSTDATIPTIDLIKKMNMEKQVIVQSFNHEQIKLVRQIAPEVATMILVNRPLFDSEPQKAAKWLVNKVLSADATGLAIRYNWLTPELVEITKEWQIALFVWTVNSKGGFNRLGENEVQGIITNKPQLIIPLLK